jgi:hypothetical protein
MPKNPNFSVLFSSNHISATPQAKEAAILNNFCPEWTFFSSQAETHGKFGKRSVRHESLY